jgi:hypothetical protein
MGHLRIRPAKLSLLREAERLRRSLQIGSRTHFDNEPTEGRESRIYARRVLVQQPRYTKADISIEQALYVSGSGSHDVDPSLGGYHPLPMYSLGLLVDGGSGVRAGHVFSNFVGHPLGPKLGGYLQKDAGICRKQGCWPSARPLCEYRVQHMGRMGQCARYIL